MAQGVVDGGHDSDLLDVRGIAVEVRDREIALAGMLDVADRATGILRELLGGASGIRGRGRDHVRLDGFKPREQEFGAIGIVSREQDAFAHQLTG